MSRLRVESITKYGGAVIYVNNKRKYYSNIVNVENLGRGRFLVYRSNHREPFSIEGGKDAGGARTDWFLDGPGLPGTGIRANSLVDAMNLIDEL